MNKYFTLTSVIYLYILSLATTVNVENNFVFVATTVGAIAALYHLISTIFEGKK